MKTSLPFIIVGAGGHGRVLLDAIIASGFQAIGFTDPDETLHTVSIYGIPVLGADDVIQSFSTDQIQLANGIGSISSTVKRKEVYQYVMSMGYRFGSIIHPKSIVSPFAHLTAGVQVMAGAVIQPGASIEENSIINTGAVIDHDCIMGKHCHVGPGVLISGGVNIGEGVHVGTGACILQGVVVGSHALIAAGAVVIRDVASESKVAGVPAKPMEPS